jgi:uronate dehydrogenase
MKNSTILVTGMSGLIGGLAGRQLAKNYDVSALGRSNVEGFPNSIADIGDGIDSILPALDGVETVIHMAGSRRNVPAETHIKANVTGLYNLFEACRITGVNESLPLVPER